MLLGDNLLVLSCLGQVTLAAMDEMFEAARAIMHWFGECAKVCSHFFSVY